MVPADRARGADALAMKFLAMHVESDKVSICAKVIERSGRGVKVSNGAAEMWLPARFVQVRCGGMLVFPEFLARSRREHLQFIPNRKPPEPSTPPIGRSRWFADYDGDGEAP
jgi:hypothetical protein